MTVVEALVIVLVCFLFYVIVKWMIENSGTKIPDVVLVTVTIILAILFLVGFIPFPDLGIGESR